MPIQFWDILNDHVICLNSCLIRDKQNINEEMNLRRQMITLINKKIPS